MSSADGLPPPGGSALRAWIAVASILAIAAALRIAGGWNDLWLDEIWSIDLAREVNAPLDVVTRFHHEINHYLNTGWLWLAGPHGNWFGYRVPSLVEGIATVAVAGWIARRHGHAALLFAMLTVGLSYVLVLYSSEVRGYAGLVLFSFLSFGLAGDYLRRGDPRTGVAFSLCATLGLLSHLAFVSVLGSTLTWFAWSLLSPPIDLKRAIVRGALTHALPVLALAGLYWVDVRELIPGGGGTSGSLLDAYGSALAWALGAPVSDAAQLVGAIAATVVLVAGLRLVRRADAGEAIFFACAIVVFPVLLVIVRQSPVLYTRHFILPIALLVLLLGFVLADLYGRGGWTRAAAVALLLAYGAANGAHLRELFALGRGQNGDAIRFIVEHSGPGKITIASDDDYRIQRVVEFYRPEEGGGREIEFLTGRTWAGAGPEWVIVNRDSYELPVSRGDQIVDGAGRRFDLVQAFPAAPLAGLHWFLYRNPVH